MSVDFHAEKFNIVSNDHGRTDRYDFSDFDRKFPFWVNSIKKKIKILSLSWNLVPRLIQVYRIQWRCSLFHDLDWKQPKSKLLVLAEIWYLGWFEYAVFSGTVHFFWFTFRPERPFLGKFSRKSQNCQFKLKFCT